MTAETWGLAEGDEIAPGRYAMQLLGGGHRYEAYLSWDDRLHSLVVAKLLRPDLVQDTSALRGLAAEATLVGSLDHPVLLRSFGAVLGGDRPHLVLEHLEGPRLSTLLRRQRRLAVEQALPLGAQLSSALIYMHHERVVHLDVKPRNIIMGGPPRLIDLSVARSFEDAERAHKPIGTDAYMAPEQCEPNLVGPMGPQSDVWGWAVTMHEALTGALPFPKVGAEDADRFPQLYLDPAPLDDDIPDVLADLVMSGLQKRPEDRPTQRDIADQVESLQAALPRRVVLSRLRPGSRRTHQ